MSMASALLVWDPEWCIVKEGWRDHLSQGSQCLLHACTLFWGAWACLRTVWICSWSSKCTSGNLNCLLLIVCLSGEPLRSLRCVSSEAVQSIPSSDEDIEALNRNDVWNATQLLNTIEWLRPKSYHLRPTSLPLHLLLLIELVFVQWGCSAKKQCHILRHVISHTHTFLWTHILTLKA